MRLQLHMYFDGRGRLRTADDTKIADAGAHALAADVEFGRSVMHGGDGTFKTEAAENNTIADGRRGARGHGRLRR